MKGNANKIVIAIAAALTVVALSLVFASGSCSTGGGGTSAPAAGEASASKSSDWDPNANYETLRDELLAELSSGTAPIGSNARDASSSQSGMTVAEIHAELESRGFGSMTLSASFDTKGNYLGPTRLDPTSIEAYPSYQADYKSSTGIQWRLVINEGRVFAVPTSLSGATAPKEIILSEYDGITQYDGKRNTYSDFTFAEIGDAAGVQVGKIDASLLDSYSTEMLNRL